SRRVRRTSPHHTRTLAKHDEHVPLAQQREHAVAHLLHRAHRTRDIREHDARNRPPVRNQHRLRERKPDQKDERNPKQQKKHVPRPLHRHHPNRATRNEAHRRKRARRRLARHDEVQPDRRGRNTKSNVEERRRKKRHHHSPTTAPAPTRAPSASVMRRTVRRSGSLPGTTSV